MNKTEIEGIQLLRKKNLKNSLKDLKVKIDNKYEYIKIYTNDIKTINKEIAKLEADTLKLENEYETVKRIIESDAI